MATLAEVARTDDLTGLPNRRAWDEALERELARAQRDVDARSASAIVDLDRFKDYNDVHGHQAGDRLLKQLAAAWGAELRATDVLARYGGEEFALALPGCDLDDAGLLVERLRAATPAEQTALGRARALGRHRVRRAPLRPRRQGPLCGQGSRPRPDRHGLRSPRWRPTARNLAGLPLRRDPLRLARADRRGVKEAGPAGRAAGAGHRPRRLRRRRGRHPRPRGRGLLEGPQGRRRQRRSHPDAAAPRRRGRRPLRRQVPAVERRVRGRLRRGARQAADHPARRRSHARAEGGRPGRDGRRPRPPSRWSRSSATRSRAPASAPERGYPSLPAKRSPGGVAERLNAAVSKTVSGDYSSDVGSNPTPSVNKPDPALRQAILPTRQSHVGLGKRRLDRVP